MLFDVQSGKPITRLPHAAKFTAWASNLSQAQFDAILDEIDTMVSGDKIHTAGWMPGSDWTGTPFDPIYTHACRNNHLESGLCFGLFVYLVIMERPEAWACGRYEKDGIPIQSLTYFRIPGLDNKVPVGYARGSSGYLWKQKGSGIKTAQGSKTNS